MKRTSYFGVLCALALAPFFDLMGIADGVRTGADGGFTFSAVVEDEYVLLVSIKGGAVKVKDSPGVIRISAERPLGDAGVIKVYRGLPY